MVLTRRINDWRGESEGRRKRKGGSKWLALRSKRQTADRADGDAFGALLAPRLGEDLVLKCGNHALKTSAREPDRADFQFLPADPHALSAKDAFVGIICENRAAVIDRKVLWKVPESLRLEFESEMFGDILQFARPVLLTAAALYRVRSQKEFGRGSRHSQGRFTPGADDHSLPHGLRAGRNRFISSFHFDKTEPARAQRFFPVPDGAEVGDIDSVLQSCPEDLFTFGSPYFLTINRYGDLVHVEPFLYALCPMRFAILRLIASAPDRPARV